MMKRCLLLIGLLLSPAWADVLILKDGTRLEGDVKRTDAGWTVTTGDGKVHNVSASSVRTIELGSTPRAGLQAAAGLASLRRSVEALSDINQIIERYQRFIELTKDAAVVAEAREDLETWQQRRRQGLVKHGAKWVSPSEVEAIVARATILSNDARELMRENRTREAEQLLQTALAEDPTNPAANYLRGVLLYRADKLPDARKAFESVAQVIPGHPPTLNNLAVILWRQNQQNGALNYFDQALQASGVNKYILDNVAEALGAIPEDQKKGQVIARTMRRFMELDVVLQQQMAQQGLYRWGSTWVDQRKLDELKSAELEVRNKLESLLAEFEQSKARIAQIDQEVRQNERSMDEMRSASLFLDRDGRYITLPLPNAYYDLQRQNQQLRAEQEALNVKLRTMQDQARRVRGQVPVPQFTGIQQIVGVEGMPGPHDLPVPAAPTTTSSSGDAAIGD